MRLKKKRNKPVGYLSIFVFFLFGIVNLFFLLTICDANAMKAKQMWESKNVLINTNVLKAKKKLLNEIKTDHYGPRACTKSDVMETCFTSSWCLGVACFFFIVMEINLQFNSYKIKSRSRPSIQYEKRTFFMFIYRFGPNLVDGFVIDLMLIQKLCWKLDL